MKGSRFRLLPVVIVVSLAMLTIRLGSLWQGFVNGTPVATNAAVANSMPPVLGSAQAAGGGAPAVTAGTRPLSEVMAPAATVIAPPQDAAVQVAEADAPVPSAQAGASVKMDDRSSAAGGSAATAPDSLTTEDDQLAEATASSAAKPKPKPKAKANPADLTSLSVGAALASDPLRGNCGNYSDSEVDLLQKLGQRREVLDQRQSEIDQRQALMTAAEGRIDKKIADLKELQASIQDLLKKADDQEQVKIDQLVKVYASMKPTDAARILNQMDMKILLTIVGSMKESKSAPILAAMESDKARMVTEEMSRHRAAGGPPPPAPAAAAAPNSPTNG